MAIDGSELAGALRGRQVPLLLAYLVLNRERPIRRDELLGALWPGQAPVSQDGALRTLLSRLRKALGGDAVIGREEIELVLPSPVWIDFEAASLEMERASRALDAGQHRNAWALAQVPLNIAGRGLLPGSTADWLEAYRRELEEVRLRALEVVGRAGLSLGGRQLAAVQRAGRGLIDAEPYRESGYMLLMEALAGTGNTAEALRVFERLRRLLSDELGTMPSREMLELHRRLLGPASEPATEQHAGATTIELPGELRMSASRPLVGRAQQLATLASALPSGDGPDHGRLVLLRGESGVGKTRLIAEVAARAHAAGAIVLAGRTPQDALVPYQPFVEALRHYILGAGLEELRRHSREYGADLAPLAPELARRLPELARREPGERLGERYRLFEAFVGLLTEIARSAPLVLVLDDLHWADRTTLLLLRHVARAPALRRVLLLGAYRSTETPSDSFTEALAELRRDRIATELDLPGLSEAEVAELVQVVSGSAPSPALVRAMFLRTDGNPFFVEEIVRQLQDSGVELAGAGAGVVRTGVPQQVRDVITRRLGELDGGAIDVLRAAAVIGSEFDVEVLDAAIEVDAERFDAALEAALAAGLIREIPDVRGLYCFAHALIRETLYEGMAAPRRARIHRRVAEALERGPVGAGGRLGALAFHFTRAAGSAEAGKAIEYSMQAGEQAMAVLAHEEAAELYAGALSVQTRFQPLGDAGNCRLLLALGEALIGAGDRSAAWEAFRQAAALADELGDVEGLTRAAIGASHPCAQQPIVVDQQLIALLERALAATAGQRTLERIVLLARLCGAIYYSPHRDRMAALSAEAGAIAAELGDPAASAHAHAAERRARWRPPELSARIVASTAMLRCAREAGDLELELQAHAWLTVDLLEHGDLEGVEAQVEAFALGAERVRQPLYLWTAELWRAMQAHMAGDLSAAEEHAGVALELGAGAEPVSAPRYHATQLFAIRAEQLRLGEMRDVVEVIAAEDAAVPTWRVAAARILVERGELDAAAGQLDALADDDFASLPADGNWIAAVSQLVEVCRRLGDGDRAKRLYRRLAPFAELNAVVALSVICYGSSHRYLGLLAAIAGERERAREHLEHALVANGAPYSRLWLAHTQLDLAELLRGGPRAAELVGAAAAISERLAVPALDQRVCLLR